MLRTLAPKCHLSLDYQDSSIVMCQCPLIYFHTQYFHSNTPLYKFLNNFRSGRVLRLRCSYFLNIWILCSGEQSTCRIVPKHVCICMKDDYLHLVQTSVSRKSPWDINYFLLILYYFTYSCEIEKSSQNQDLKFKSKRIWTFIAFDYYYYYYCI